MKPRDPVSALASLFLFGSILFLASGAAAWFLRSDEPADESSDRGARAAANGARSESSEPQGPRPAALDRTRVEVGHAEGTRESEEARRAVSTSPDWPGGLLPELTITGRVLDASGAPLGGATVSLELRPGSLLADPAGSSPLLEETATVSTSADGRFTFHGPGPGGIDPSIVLFVRTEPAAAHAPQVVRAGFESGSTRCDVGDIRLLVGGRLLGRVVDPAGSGVANAAVTLQPVPPNPLQSWKDGVAVLQPASTRSSGFFEFASLTPGAWRVSVKAAGMQVGRLRDAILVEDGVDSEVESILLVPGFEVSICVLGPGKEPIAGAELRLRSLGSGARFNDLGTTTADGRFGFEHLPPGRMQIDAEAVGYLRAPRQEFEAGVDLEVTVQLPAGLGVSGVVVDASSGAPVERFATRVRKIASSDGAVESAGTPARVLRQRIRALGESTQTIELEERLRALERSAGSPRTQRIPAGIGPITERPQGRFEFAGLDEGTYAVEIASPDHRFASLAPVEVRRGTPSPDLRLEVVRGVSLAGQVVARAGGVPLALANAAVELFVVDDAWTEAPSGRERDGRPSRFGWAFDTPGPRGDLLMSTRTDPLGRFELRHAPPGRYFLTASHPDACRIKSAPFELREDRDDFELSLGLAASLTGRVRGIPEGRESDAGVLVVGGGGTMRTARTSAEGTWQVDRLQPGGYAVRAFLGDPSDALSAKLAAIFAEDRETSAPDVTLEEGEQRECDVTLELPKVGAVEGSLTINGQPAPGFQVVLRLVSGASSGARWLRALPNPRGAFAIADLPPGSYTLQVMSTSSRQELHKETILVAAEATTRIQAILSVGGLRGSVTAGGAVPPEQIEGTLTLLPGATAAPEDLRAYGLEHRVHSLRVRNGAFQAEHLVSGRALVLLEIVGREPLETTIEIPARSILETTFRVK